MAAESYSSFHVGGNAIAERGAITPEAHDSQDTLILIDSPTLHHERAMDVSVGTDDKAHTYIHVVVVNVQQGIGGKQGFRRPDAAALG